MKKTLMLAQAVLGWRGRLAGARPRAQEAQDFTFARLVFWLVPRHQAP